MQYEVYADSLLFLNFVMNLYLLIPVNQGLLERSGPGRLFAGAGFGAVSYFLPFLLPGALWFKLLAGMGVGTAGMILIAFPVKSLKGFLRILEKLLIYSFFLGGLLLFLIRRLPLKQRSLINIYGIMGAGAAGFLLLSHFLQKREKSPMCRVTLICGEEQVKITALVDSGNSLIEPVSGKPVSIIEEEVFRRLWKGEEALFRAIPYHSIGKKRGILQGYLLPELLIEADGEMKVCREVYVAVSKELCSENSVKMILHPALLQDISRNNRNLRVTS